MDLLIDTFWGIVSLIGLFMALLIVLFALAERAEETWDETRRHLRPQRR